MKDLLSQVYDTICKRKESSQEGSYTGYLFEQGIDKILKKVGEESAELIIASKNGDKKEIIAETSDLFYHILVLLANENVKLSEIYEELEYRHQNTGNLKVMKTVNKNT